MNLESKIEALLFFKAEPTSLKKLADILEKSEQDIAEAVSGLRKSLALRGVAILEKDGEVMLGTAPEASNLIEKVVKEELHRELGKAGLETLSIVIYLGPVSRSQIDYIRGVSSTFILRNLLIRGLVERVDNPTDRRSFLYKPTFELLSYLGVRTVEDMPEYAVVREELTARQKAAAEAEERETDETLMNE